VSALADTEYDMKKLRTRPTLTANVHIKYEARIAVHLTTAVLPFINDPGSMTNPHISDWSTFNVGQGWIYIFNEDYKEWTELKVTPDGNDVDRYQICFQGAEPPASRPPTGPPDHFFYVREGCRYRVAVSRVQWSQERFIALQYQPARNSRAARPIVSERASGIDGVTVLSSLLQPREIQPQIKPAVEHPIEVWQIQDPLRYVRTLADGYQRYWTAMERCLESMNNDRLRDCAVLIKTVHAVPGVHQSDLEELDIETVDQILCTKQRETLRVWIDLIKVDLTQNLRRDTIRDGLVEAIDDYALLPVESGEGEQVHCHAELWVLMDELLTNISLPCYAQDLDIISNVKEELDREKSGRDDPGLKLLIELSDPSAGHPLHEYLFPGESIGADPAQPAVRSPGDPRLDLKRFDESLQVGRKTVEALFKFCTQFELLGIESSAKSARTHVVSLIALADLSVKNAIVKVGDYIAGEQLPGDDLFIHAYFKDTQVSVANWDEAKQVHSPPIELPNGKKAMLNVSVKTIGNKVIQAAGHFAKAIRNGSAGLKRWVDFRDEAKWKKIEVEVIVMTKPKGLARTALDNPGLRRYVQAAWLMLEGWNVNASVRALRDSPELDLKKSAAVLSALGDLTSTVRDIMGMELDRQRILVKSSPMSAIDETTAKLLKHSIFGRIALANSVWGFTSSVMDFYENMNEKRYGVASGHLMLAASSFMMVMEGSAAVAGMTLGRSFGWVGVGIAVVGVTALCWFTNSPLKDWVISGPFWSGAPKECSEDDWVYYKDDAASEQKMRAALVSTLIRTELLVAYSKDPTDDKWQFEPSPSGLDDPLAYGPIGRLGMRSIRKVALAVHDPLGLLLGAVLKLDMHWSAFDLSLTLVGVSPGDRFFFRELFYWVARDEPEEGAVDLRPGQDSTSGAVGDVEVDKSGSYRILLDIPDKLLEAWPVALELEVGVVIDVFGDGKLKLEKRTLSMRGTN
jgi:hypothetical protein